MKAYRLSFMTSLAIICMSLAVRGQDSAPLATPESGGDTDLQRIEALLRAELEGLDEQINGQPERDAEAEDLGVTTPESADPEPSPVFTLRHDEPDQQAVMGDNERLISVMLEDMSLQNVISMFTRISGANIIASGADMDGFVTVNLTDVDWKTALESILDMHNLTLREHTPGSAVYSVVPKSPDAPEPMHTEPIFLRYARVADALTIVRSLLVSGGAVSPYASGNALVIRTTSPNLAEIRKVIESIDRPRQQVYIEAKFLELNDDAIKTLGINWQVLEGYRVGVSELAWGLTDTRSWDRSRDDTSLRSDEHRQTDAISEYYDVDGAQYQRETFTDRESPPGSGRYVTDRTLEPTRTIEDRVDRRYDVRSEQSDRYARSIKDIRSAVLSASDMNIILSALRQMDGVSIVSNPKIMVANEEEATIHIGEKERPFISSVTPGQQGIAPVVTYNPGEEVDFGVKLSVTPTINTDSNITVRIEPELTRFVRDAVAPNGQSYPIIATKTIRTIFSLEDGKTAAIGGLTETTERDMITKVPLLGDIPLIGRFLFSHERREKSQKETIIFVTVGLANPHVIERDEGLPEDARLIHRYMLRDQARAAAAISDTREKDRGRVMGFLWRR